MNATISAIKAIIEDANNQGDDSVVFLDSVEGHACIYVRDYEMDTDGEEFRNVVNDFVMFMVKNALKFRGSYVGCNGSEYMYLVEGEYLALTYAHMDF